MSVPQEILIILGGYASGYKHMKKMIHGVYPEKPADFRNLIDTSPGALRVALTRLKKRGLVKSEQSAWSITKKGKNYLSKYITKVEKTENSRSQKTFNMIVAFDIPERYKDKRDWLRNRLVGLEFTQLQKSMWLGPAPLPVKFVKDLHRLKLLRYIKLFKATEKEIV